MWIRRQWTIACSSNLLASASGSFSSPSLDANKESESEWSRSVEISSEDPILALSEVGLVASCKRSPYSTFYVPLLIKSLVALPSGFTEVSRPQLRLIYKSKERIYKATLLVNLP